MNILEAKNLTHQFSKEQLILDNIHLEVPQGSIFGFLGPNGAGKTTTLSLILGLLKKQQGEISIFGKNLTKNRVEILKNIGSLIESPSLYAQLTARENLLVWQKIYQCPKNRIEKVLDLVGLSDTAEKKAAQFSLGMKQRLAIAAALLHEPKLLILDEPTNGLDPSGIVEMRELLKKLNKENGISILISSHLLSEIEKLVTDVGIINHGKMLFQGSLETLFQVKNEVSSIVFEVDNPIIALEILQKQQIFVDVEQNKLKIQTIPNATIAKLNEEFVKNNVAVFGIQRVENDLETIFMNLTNQ